MLFVMLIFMLIVLLFVMLLLCYNKNINNEVNGSSKIEINIRILQNFHIGGLIYIFWGFMPRVHPKVLLCL